MKQLIILTLFLANTLVAMSQYTDSLHRPAEHYLVKSRSQRAGAVVLTVLGSVGLLVTIKNDNTDLSGVGNMFGSTGSSPEPGRRSFFIPYFLSAAALVAAIPLYVGAAKNKHTYYRLSAHVKFEERTVLQQNTINSVSYPALVLKVQLR